MNLKQRSNIAYVSNKKKKDQIKTKQFNWKHKTRIHLNYYKCYINIPFSWNMIILKTNHLTKIYLYSTTYFVHTGVPKNFVNFYYDPNTRIVGFSNLYENNYKNLYLNQLTYLLSLCNNPCFLKIKFKGKGYYIYKNKRKTITPQFGFAHRHYIYAFYASVKFRSKTSIMLYGSSIVDLIEIGSQIKSLRSINIFTGRGVRFNKQIIYKKTGKVSSYR
jgi:hypothetical protein